MKCREFLRVCGEGKVDPGGRCWLLLSCLKDGNEDLEGVDGLVGRRDTATLARSAGLGLSLLFDFLYHALRSTKYDFAHRVHPALCALEECCFTRSPCFFPTPHQSLSFCVKQHIRIHISRIRCPLGLQKLVSGFRCARSASALPLDVMLHV